MVDYLTSRVYHDKDELIPVIEPERIVDAINIK